MRFPRAIDHIGQNKYVNQNSLRKCGLRVIFAVNNLFAFTGPPVLGNTLWGIIRREESEGQILYFRQKISKKAVKYG